jgi:SnoaL-like domain
MASRVEIAKQYMDLMREQKMDEMMDALADDVTMSNPMTGTITGKDALRQQVQNRPAGGAGGGMGDINWSDPEEEGDSIKILGTGSPFGTIKIVLSFNDDDKINKIDAGLA